MPDLSKEIDKEIEEMRDDEVPEIDIEMALQRKFPKNEAEVVPHNGEPGLSHDAQIATEMADPLITGYHYNRENKKATVTWQIPNFEIACIWNVGQSAMPTWVVNGKQSNNEKIDSLFPSLFGASAHLFETAHGILMDFDEPYRDDKRGGPPSPRVQTTNWDDKRTMLQAVKLDKIAAAGDPGWVLNQRMQDLKDRLRALQERSRKGLPPENTEPPKPKAAPPLVRKKNAPAPKPVVPKGDLTEAPGKDKFDLADDIFYKEFYGAASSGDAGMQYGWERIPIGIYAKLMRRGIETTRKGLKWDTLTPDEFEKAFNAMYSCYSAARKRMLSHMNQKKDGQLSVMQAAKLDKIYRDR